VHGRTVTIIDSHLHIIDPERLRYPWLEAFGRLRGSHLYETYALEARRCGISACLHMEVDVAEDQIEAESAMAGDLMRQRDSLMRGAISSCRPESVEFPAFLERQLANPVVKGFRRVLHVVPDDVSEAMLFRQNLSRLSGTRFPFDLCVLPHQIPKAIALADLCPGLQFVLDHCGVPAIRDRADHPWREHVAEIVRRPNVAVKVSGIVDYADGPSWTVEALKPYLEHAIACFGWDRVVWGSDWPICTIQATLSTWVAATHALLSGRGKDERDRLFRHNAERIWNLR
jgi:predicted TIM-barrel fold metal-dependent hydrolase